VIAFLLALKVFGLILGMLLTVVGIASLRDVANWTFLLVCLIITFVGIWLMILCYGAL